MTDADLDRIAAELDAIRLRFLAKASARIAKEVGAAHAHAFRAITDRLKATEDGRPTARLGVRSPSFRAAIGHLDDLLDWLAGPSVVSLAGLVRDAREALYRRAFMLHRPLVPAELHVAPDPEPTVAGIRFVRAFPLHGLDARQELQGHIDAVRRALTAAVASAGASGVPERRERDLLDTWERQARDRLTNAVTLALSDSVGLCDVQALEDLIHPDHIEA